MSAIFLSPILDIMTILYMVFMKTYCLLCHLPGPELCPEHEKLYVWDSSIKGYRLKKRTLGSRYTDKPYHKREVNLTKIIESYFGKSKVVSSYHPIWAIGYKGVLLEYDIHIKGTNILIEYNSDIHYIYTKFFHKTYKKFLEQVERDELKKELAEKNGYKLIIFTQSDPMIKTYIIRTIKENQRS